jgi:predicted lipoprotein with Yx(FWY)xxD motif
MTTISRLAAVAGATLAVALVASACSSSGSNSGGSGTSNSPGGAASATVETHSGPLGTYLTDGAGKSLYLFESDTATKSTCNGACVAYWPPLTGTPHAMGGVAAGKLTTITRSDGSKQVAYAGHPLYYFKEDSSPGDTNGQGSSNFGAKWYLLTPSGSAITSANSGSSSSGNGGY